MAEANTKIGIVKFIGEVEKFPSGFQKRTFVIECEDGKYTNDYAFELMKDKVDQTDGISIGDEVSVKINDGTSREYNGKWYTNHATCWNLKATTDSPQGTNNAQTDTQCGSWTEDKPPAGDDDSDSIPF